MDASLRKMRIILYSSGNSRKVLPPHAKTRNIPRLIPSPPPLLNASRVFNMEPNLQTLEVMVMRMAPPPVRVLYRLMKKLNVDKNISMKVSMVCVYWGALCMFVCLFVCWFVGFSYVLVIP